MLSLAERQKAGTSLSSDRATEVSAQLSCEFFRLAQEMPDQIFLKGTFLKVYLFFTYDQEK